MAGENVVTLSDFTPGIYSNGNYASNVPPAPLGAAQEANTYRCIGLRGGGLAPLPKRVNDYTIPHPGVGTTTTVVGIQVIRTIKVGNTGFEHVYMLLDTDTSPRRVYGKYLETAGSTWTNVTWAIGSYPPISAVTTSFITNDSTTPIGCASDIIPTAGSIPGEALRGIVVCFPGQDVTIPGARGVYVIGVDPTNYYAQQVGGVHPSAVFYHQSRIVRIDVAKLSQLNATDYSLGLESLRYYAPFLPSTGAAAIATALAFDHSQPIGSWGSVSTGELFLVGQSINDSVLIQGDLNNPNIVPMRGVQPTGALMARGLNSKLGILFPSENNGVWAWSGSNTAEKISPQLRDDFFKRTTDTYASVPVFSAGSPGSYGESLHPAMWGDFALYPNNFLLDTNNGSWWRLEDTATKNIMSWSADFPRYLYGAVDSIVAATTNSLSRFDSQTPANSYSWQSQPIPVDTLNSLVEVYDIEVKAVPSVASTNQTVTITLTGDDGTTQSEVFTFNSSLSIPKRLRKPTGGTATRGFDIICRIEADGGANPAPIVHSVTLSYRLATATSDT